MIGKIGIGRSSSTMRPNVYCGRAHCFVRSIQIGADGGNGADSDLDGLVKWNIAMSITHAASSP